MKNMVVPKYLTNTPIISYFKIFQKNILYLHIQILYIFHHLKNQLASHVLKDLISYLFYFFNS